MQTAKKIFENLRTLQSHEQKTLAFVGAGICTVLILFVWFMDLRGDNLSESARDSIRANSPFSVIQNMFSANLVGNN